jgi:hypothetical protein
LEASVAAKVDLMMSPGMKGRTPLAKRLPSGRKLARTITPKV